MSRYCHTIMTFNGRGVGTSLCKFKCQRDFYTMAFPLASDCAVGLNSSERKKWKLLKTIEERRLTECLRYMSCRVLKMLIPPHTNTPFFCPALDNRMLRGTWSQCRLVVLFSHPPDNTSRNPGPIFTWRSTSRSNSAVCSYSWLDLCALVHVDSPALYSHKSTFMTSFCAVLILCFQEALRVLSVSGNHFLLLFYVIFSILKHKN